MKSCIVILNDVLNISYFLEPNQDTSTFRANNIIAEESEPSTAEFLQKWFLLKHECRLF